MLTNFAYFIANATLINQFMVIFSAIIMLSAVFITVLMLEKRFKSSLIFYFVNRQMCFLAMYSIVHLALKHCGVPYFENQSLSLYIVFYVGFSVPIIFLMFFYRTIFFAKK